MFSAPPVIQREVCDVKLLGFLHKAGCLASTWHSPSKMPLNALLPRFIQHFLRSALGMSPPNDPVPGENLNDPLRVGLMREADEYVLGLQIKYIGIGIGYERTLPVVQVDVLKQRNHQYLIVHVAAGGKKHYILFERLGNRHAPRHRPSFLPTPDNNLAREGPSTCSPYLVPLASASTTPCSSQVSFGSSFTVASNMRPLLAFDRVRVLPDPYDFWTDKVVLTLNLTDQPLYLHEIAVLASHLHHHNDNYKLFSSDSFWYAASLMHILEEYTGLAAKVVGKRRGFWSRGNIPVYHRPKDPEMLKGDVQCFRQDVIAYVKNVS